MKGLIREEEKTKIGTEDLLQQHFRTEKNNLISNKYVNNNQHHQTFFTWQKNIQQKYYFITK